MELEKLCLEALVKKPSARLASVTAMHERLQSWLEAETDSSPVATRISFEDCAHRRQKQGWQAACNDRPDVSCYDWEKSCVGHSNT